MRTGVRILAAVIATSGVVACSDPKAAPLPTARPTTVAPTTPSPTPTASPDYEAQARRAIDEYIKALQDAALDPARHTDALEALLSPQCACREVLRVLRELASQRHYIDYRYTLRNVAVVEAGPIGANVRYTVDQSPGAERDQSGRVVQTFPRATTTYDVRLVNRDGNWLLDRVEELR